MFKKNPNLWTPLDDFVLFEYLRQLLLESDLTVDHQASIAGVIEDVENKDKLVKLLCRLYTQQISPYDYESKKWRRGVGVRG